MTLTRRDFVRTTVTGSALLGLGACSGPGSSGGDPPSGSQSSTGHTPLNILVLGGTGFIGPYQVRHALSRGHNVTLFNRGQSNPELFSDLEQLVGDRSGDLTALEGRSWDAVIDNSATDPEWVRASAQLLSGSVEQYLYVSSTGVYYPYHTPGVDETVQPSTSMIADDGSSTYGVNKTLSEKEVETALPGRTIVVRPHFIGGPGDPTDRFSSWPVRLSRGTPCIAPGTPLDPVQFVDVRDVTEFMIHLIESKDAGIYNAAGPSEPTGVGQFIQDVREGIGSSTELVWIDDLDFLDEESFAGVPWIPPRGDLAAMAQVSNEKAVRHGLELRPTVDTARDTIEWWREQPADRQNDLRHGPSAEREAEILAAWASRSDIG